MVAKAISVEQAASLIMDGATITVSGIGGTMYPETVMAALEARFLADGHPQGLFWFDPSPTGTGPGFEHLAHEGLLRRVIESWFVPMPNLIAMIKANKVEAYSYPLATGHFLTREIAAGRQGYLTKVGLHTYVDPRQGGARLNARTTEDMVEVREFGGEEWIWYKGFPISVAIIRGTSADEVGNIGYEEETHSLSALNQAQAAKSTGGIVIAQVKRRVKKGALHPRHVLVPGWLVDFIVVDPQQPQSAGFPDRYIEGATGGLLVPEPPITVHAMSPDKLAGRRAALELHPGDVINVGAGTGATGMVPSAREEGLAPLYTHTAEHGTVVGLHGGFTGATVINPTYMPDYVTLFHHYYGGNLASCFLALGEVDKEGNNNLNRLGDLLIGPGGSMDIAQGTRRIIFCGTFTAGGLQVEAKGGRLRIVREGSIRRFVNRIQDICFNGRDFWALGKDVIFVTERAVFRLTAKGIELTEVAPGIDVEREVLGRMEFRPEVSPQLKQMDARIFDPKPMGLHLEWTGQPFVPKVEMVTAEAHSFGPQLALQGQPPQ